jgi:hypothetical protein
MLSRAFWPCAPATASVPMGMRKPAFSARVNIGARLGTAFSM